MGSLINYETFVRLVALAQMVPFQIPHQRHSVTCVLIDPERETVDDTKCCRSNGVTEQQELGDLWLVSHC